MIAFDIVDNAVLFKAFAKQSRILCKGSEF